MFSVNINTDNDAFYDAPMEIERILQRIAADMVMRGMVSGACIDYDGNKVGSWSYEDGK